MLSIIILTYNQENMVKRCLDSLLRSRTSNVELIIADDCSRDGTATVISNWIAMHDSHFFRVSFLKNTKNIGTVRNVIQAVSSSTGDFIKLLAGDDWFTDHALDSMQTFIQENAFDVAFSDILSATEDTPVPDEQGKDSKYHDIAPFFALGSEEQFDFLALRNRLPAPAALFSRAFWNEIELEKCQLVYTEDWAMWLLGTLKKSHFKRIDIPLVVYYMHSKSVSRKPDSRIFKRYMQDVAWTYKTLVLPNKNKLKSKTRLKVFLRYGLVKMLTCMPLQVIGWFAQLKSRL